MSESSSQTCNNRSSFHHFFNNFLRKPQEFPSQAVLQGLFSKNFKLLTPALRKAFKKLPPEAFLFETLRKDLLCSL